MIHKINWKNSLISKITLSYIGLTAIPFILSYFLTSTLLWNETKEHLLNHSKDALESTKQFTNIYLKQMEALSLSIYYNNELVSLLENDMIFSDDSEKIKLFKQFDKLFHDYSHSRPDVFNFYFFDLKGNLIYAYNGGFWTDFYPEIIMNHSSEFWFKETINRDGKTNILSSGIPPHDSTRSVFSISRLIKTSNKPRGVVLLDFNFSALNDSIGKSSFINKGDVIITNFEGNIIYHNGKYFNHHKNNIPKNLISKGNTKNSLIQKIELNNSDYFMVSDTLNNFSIKIIHLIPLSMLISDNLRMMWKINIFIIIIMIFLMILWIYYFHKRLRPLKSLSYAMKQYMNEPFDKRISISTNDEIGLLGKSFNIMISHLQKLFEKDFKNKMELLETEKRMLEAQINPHFLYNTLDTIRFKSIEQGNKEISEMLFNLSANLRYTISNSNIRVYVHEEIQWLERYIYLLKLRFEDKFNVIFSIDYRINNIMINRLILQPFVENAIIHGFKDIESGGVLKIHGYLDHKNNLIFEIIDNGCGFKKKIEKIIDENSIKSLNQEGIGMVNSLNRLFLYYGKKCKVFLKSAPSEGTLIRIYIHLGGDRFENTNN